MFVGVSDLANFCEFACIEFGSDRSDVASQSHVWAERSRSLKKPEKAIEVDEVDEVEEGLAD